MIYNKCDEFKESLKWRTKEFPSLIPGTTTVASAPCGPWAPPSNCYHPGRGTRYYRLQGLVGPAPALAPLPPAHQPANMNPRLIIAHLEGFSHHLGSLPCELLHTISSPFHGCFLSYHTHLIHFNLGVKKICISPWFVLWTTFLPLPHLTFPPIPPMPPATLDGWEVGGGDNPTSSISPPFLPSWPVPTHALLPLLLQLPRTTPHQYLAMPPLSPPAQLPCYPSLANSNSWARTTVPPPRFMDEGNE